ncbi:MAG: glycosyltransferase [Alphaproteobacteria bacterium]|nr:glycosyltransferase [Alphaproteobacteria bacterium]
MSVKVSIIIPVFNIAPYLDKCMESACRQTLTDIEIIAVNDASTDNSLDILHKWQRHDARIKIINHKTNTLTAAARNDGLNMACGEYVCFLDGDDYLDTDFCEKLYNLAKRTDADIAKGMAKTINPDKSAHIAADNDDIVKHGKFYFMGRLWTALYNRTRLLTTHDIKFHIDFFCFQIQAVYFANKIVCDDTTFYNYVRHENSCDSDVFSIEKWTRLNLGHANFIYDWINNHTYTDATRKFYRDQVKWLYFYGYKKLAKSDVAIGCKILAQNICEHYNCGYNCANLKSLQHKLYRKHPKTTFADYLKNIVLHKI